MRVSSLVWALFGLGVAPVVALPACSSQPSSGPIVDAATAPDACAPAAGQAPAPSCNDVPMCMGMPAPCTATSPCLALADNTGKSVVDLRLRKLHVATPKTLTFPIVQEGLVDMGLNLTETCEGGDGGFSVLLRLDMNAKTLTAGGGPPASAATPYCFVNTTNHGFSVAPVTSPAALASDGTWQAENFAGPLNIPIFAGGALDALVTLPVRSPSIQSMQLSSDGNCVGSYASVTTCQRWTTAATLSGYITLEDADRVPIPQLSNATLCVLLTNGTGTTCARDANQQIIAPGDYCSQTQGPATTTCADSFWLASTFAASAVTIGDGAGVPLCEGSAADAATE